MKKRMIALLLAGMLLATGCAKSTDTGSQDTASADAGQSTAVVDYTASDYVTLGEYKGVTVTLTGDYSEDDAAVEEYEKALISDAGGSFAKDPDAKTVKEDSIVNVDYKGIKDGEAFSGGSASDVTIDVANNMDANSQTGYIDGFTDGLVGAKVGTTTSSQVTFPEDYSAAELAGQEVTFEFTVNYICKEVTVDDVSSDFLLENFGVETKEEFFDYAKAKLEDENETKKNSEARQLVQQAVEDAATVDTYPDGLVEERISNYRSQYEKQYFTEGMTWSSFYSQYGVTEEDFNSQVEEVVRQNLKTELVFSAIAENEGITIDQKGYQSYVKNLMSQNGDSDEKSLYSRYGLTEEQGRDYIETIYLVNQALTFCVDKATVNPKS